MNREYIIESGAYDLGEYRMFSELGGINIFVKDPLPESINIRNIIHRVESTVPSHLSYGIELMYIGQFQDLIDREVNSIYKDGAIYLTNDQFDEDDMITDIVHEIAHSAETNFSAEIYGDSKLEVEFLKKRMILHNILNAHGYNISKDVYLNPEFNEEYDNFLYKEVGYSILEQLSSGLFISPYAVTSLREYFANGFEHFYLNQNLSENAFYKVSPALFRVLNLLRDPEER